MEIMRESDRAAVRHRLEAELRNPVNVAVFSEPASGLYVPGRRDCATCAETEQLMREVAELSDQIKLEIHNVREAADLASEWGISGVPTVAIYSGTDSGVRFLGLPSGYEFLSFLETLISAGSGDGFGLQPESLDKLKSVDEDVEIKVFSTPT